MTTGNDAITDTHTFYQWKVEAWIDKELRWLTPRADPNEYEFPFDFMFATPQQALEGLTLFSVDPEEYEDWILVKVTETKVNQSELDL